MEELKVKAMSGLVDILDKGIQGLEQIPSYIVDLVYRYGLFYGISNVLLGILLLGVSIYLIKRIKNVYHNNELYNDSKAGAITALGCALVFTTIFGVVCLYDGIKGFIVPELVLIDEFTGCSSCRG